MMASTTSSTAVAGALFSAAASSKPRGSAACPRVAAGRRRGSSCVVRCDAGVEVQAQATAKAASIAALEQFKISADRTAEQDGTTRRTPADAELPAAGSTAEGSGDFDLDGIVDPRAPYTRQPVSNFDVDGFIRRRLGVDPAELHAVLEGSDPRGVVSQRRTRGLTRKPLPLLPVP